ncbi:hypothetical protein CN067_32190 [Sinorhizobium meliloti]|nr:hypothetical protein CN111_27355 [Sinorhizobium meliloti]RVQ11421.1 hypothetical protein CN067_32190 [Sinorhizobium meliloti]RVQ24219.1 hypothetical protein CN062_30745 [Sinorhizobium meliloti]RVQ53987.1 hypothetical protein CN060_25120 [Sinorhizobium meliloti]
MALDVPANLTSSVQAPAHHKGNQYRWSIIAINGGETKRAKGNDAALGPCFGPIAKRPRSAAFSGNGRPLTAWE